MDKATGNTTSGSGSLVHRSGQATLLYLCIDKELLMLLSLLRDIPSVLNTLKEEYDNMMYLAVRKGQIDIVSTSLNNGARANIQGKGKSSNVSFLYIAAERGFENTIQMLLDKGANINAEGGHYGNALQPASTAQ